MRALLLATLVATSLVACQFTTVTGSGNLVAEPLEVDASGASTVTLAGTAERAHLRASGASDLELAGLDAVEVDATLSGASTGSVGVSSRLEAHLSGASSLAYRGDPAINQSLSAASRLRRG